MFGYRRAPHGSLLHSRYVTRGTGGVTPRSR